MKRTYITLLLIPSVFVLLRLSAIAAGSPSSDISASYVWKPVRIGAGGFMRGMAIDSMHPEVRYARGDVDNVYRWDTTFSVWVPMKVASAFPLNVSDAPTSAGCGAVAIDPRNSKVVLCAFTFNRSADIGSEYPPIKLDVYRSEDGGRTFKAGDLAVSGELENETNGEHIAIDPVNDKIVYIGTPKDGFWRSVNGGLHWTKINVVRNGAPVAAAALPRFDSSGGSISVYGELECKRIFLTTEDGGVLLSDDGGVNWADIATGIGVDGHASFSTVGVDGSFWTTSSTDNAVWSYSLSGQWTRFQTPFGGLSGVAIDPKNPNRLFISTGGGAIARSLDGGKNWLSFGNGATYSETQRIEWLRPSAIRPQQHFFSNGGIYIDVNGRLWLPGGNDGVISAQTNDAVDTLANPPVFSSVSEGIEEMVAQSIALPPGGQPVVTVEDETCFTISNPDEYSAKHYDVNLWNDNYGLSSAQDINYCPNVPTYLAITSDDIFINDPSKMSCHYSSYSLDGGEKWHRFSSIDAGTQPSVLYDGIIAISAATDDQKADMADKANIVWVPTNKYSANCPAPFYSFDGGKTWTQTKSFDTAPGSFAYTANGISYRYMGSQWGPWNVALKQHSLVADPKRPGVFYLQLTAGGFWRSIDGGGTWTQLKSTGLTTNYDHHGCLAANPDNAGDLWFIDGYEGSTGHGLWHTVDGGETFSKIAGFDYCWTLALGKQAVGAAYPTIYVFGKRSNIANWGVFRSTDEGASWNQISHYPCGLLDRPVSMAASWDRNGLLYIGYSGNSFVYGYPRN